MLSDLMKNNIRNDSIISRIMTSRVRRERQEQGAEKTKEKNAEQEEC